MPDPDTHSNVGLQLWINLARKDKMCTPHYQELSGTQVQEAEKDGINVRVIAGEAFGVHSAVRTRTPAMYLDFHMPSFKKLELPIPADYNAFLYILEGQLFLDQHTDSFDAYHLVVFERNGDHIHLTTQSKACHFVVITGQPLGEPLARQGPFVLNTEAELRQAFSDYQFGRNGFENAPDWKSEIGKALQK